MQIAACEAVPRRDDRDVCRLAGLHLPNRADVVADRIDIVFGSVVIQICRVLGRFGPRTLPLPFPI